LKHSYITRVKNYHSGINTDEEYNQPERLFDAVACLSA